MKQRFTKLLAAFALLVGLTIPMGMWGQTRSDVTWMASGQGYSNQEVVTNITLNSDISGAFAKGEGTTDPAYYNTGTGVRMYASNTLTITASSATMSQIEFTYSQNSKNLTVNTGTYTQNTGIWTGNASSVTFTTATGSGHNRVQAIKVTYSTGTIYTVNLSQTEGGTINANPAQAAAGTPITLTATPSEGYSFASWSITPNTVIITDNQFTMPACDVTVSASWTQSFNVTYDFTDLDNIWINSSHTTHPTQGTGSSHTNLTTFYYNNASFDVFTTSGPDNTDFYFSGNPSYLIMGKKDAALTLPTYEGYKITQLIIHNSSGCSQSVEVEITSGNNTVADEQLWDERNQDYTYTIPATYQTSVLTVKVANAYNAQIYSITVVREEINANRVATPTFNPNGGIITEDTDVTISCETEGATIYYTLDGTTPTINSAVYSQAIPVSATTTIKAIAVKDEMENSYMAEATYTRKYTITVTPTTGGTITASPLLAEIGDPIALTATANEGYTFGEWSITPNVSMNGNSFEMPASNVTVSATFNQRPSFTITFTTNGINDGSMQVYQGDAITTLPEATATYIPEGYAFMGWYNGDYEVSNTAPIFITEDFVPTGDVTLKAVFAEVSGSISVGTLTESEITSNLTNTTCAYGTEKTYNDSNDGITWTVSCFTDAVNRKWLQLKNDATAYIKVTASNPITRVDVTISSASNSSNGINDITKHYAFSETGVIYLNTNAANAANANHVGSTSGSDVSNYSATIVPEGDYSTLYIQTNPGSRIWGITVTCGSATYSNYCTSVTETIELPITGYGEEGGGWNLIASPVVSIDPVSAGMITDTYGSTDVTPENGTYDLYRFNQSAELEWENYRVHSFALESGKGYLYASKEGVSIQFAGAPYNSGEIPLVYDAGKDFAGWNLIGNPFAVAATLDIPYYRMNDNQTTLGAKIEGGQIAAMEGVFVYAYDTDEQQAITTATFARVGRSNNAPHGIVNLNVEQNASVVDNVIVRFDEGRSLPKLQLFEGSAEIFITKNGKDYAIVSSEAQNEMPVNFKAQENGTYTLNIDTENVEMNYLHLIDNMTGMDVDLLQTPSYTFDATTNDYASRFRLVFSANNVDGPSTGSGTFAFYSNGNWVVGNEGEATLQVIDVNGRIVSNETINGTVATSINATPGVYMLRLVNGNEVKTQKIVVK